MTKVCHVTSVHRSDDIRIFIKECTTLAAAGYDMYLVAPGDSGTVDGIKITGCGEVPQSRRERVKYFDPKVYDAAAAVDAEIYHFHDPEMLKYASRLRKLGKKVIFDSHEDVPAQIKSKPWIPAPFRGIVSAAYRAYETRNVRRLNAVITATDYIKDRFEGRSELVCAVKNYPRLDDINFSETAFSDRQKAACYAGGISHIRGEEIMIEAVQKIDGGILKLAGVCESDEIRKTDPENVEYLGKLGRDDLNRMFSESRVGLCLLLPVPNHLEALPTKIFEYMAAGLPVVASDFFPCSDEIEKADCGKIVDPSDMDAIVDAVRYYLDDPEAAQEAGRRGRETAVEKYSWTNEGNKLLEVYRIVSGN